MRIESRRSRRPKAGQDGKRRTPVQIAAVPPCRKTGIRRIIPKSEMGQAEYPGRASLGANAGHPPANARAMPPCSHPRLVQQPMPVMTTLFIFLRRQRRADVRRNVIKAELRDGIRVGQAKGERLHAFRGKVGIFTGG